MSAGDDPVAGADAPVLRVSKGSPQPGELAALATVLGALAGRGAPVVEVRRRSLWRDRSRFARPVPVSYTHLTLPTILRV